MRLGGGGRSAGVGCLVARGARIAAALGLALAAASCVSLGSSAPVADLRGTTIAVESVEGPPPASAHIFVRDLGEEAAARQLAVVPQGAQAHYRIRGYLAPQAGGGIAWAWDVYDAGQNRAFRLRGEERTGARSWGANPEAMRRIAHASIEQLATFLSSSRAATSAAAPAAPAGNPSLIAALDDFQPEAAGIFRLFGAGTPTPAPEAGREAASFVPLPPQRPAPSGPAAAHLAFNEP